MKTLKMIVCIVVFTVLCTAQKGGMVYGDSGGGVPVLANQTGSPCGTIDYIEFVYERKYYNNEPQDLYKAELCVEGNDFTNPTASSGLLNYTLDEEGYYEGVYEYEYTSDYYGSLESLLADYPMGQWVFAWQPCGSTYTLDSTSVSPSSFVEIQTLDNGLNPTFVLDFDVADGDHIYYELSEITVFGDETVAEGEWDIADAPKQWTPQIAGGGLKEGFPYILQVEIYRGSNTEVLIGESMASVVTAFGFSNSVRYVAEGAAVFTEGDGSELSPYHIQRSSQLALISSDTQYLNKCFILDNDIDMKDREFTPFAPGWATAFSGKFDGNGKIISNLTIQGGDMTAMFGNVANGAVIKNLGIENVTVTSTGSFVGAIAGWCDGSEISGCFVTGTVSGGTQVGAITAGLSGAAKISNCYSDCDVFVSGQIGGGIASDVSGSALIEYCYAAGKVSGNWVGGICAIFSGGKQPVASFYDVQANPWSAAGNGITPAQGRVYQNYAWAGWDFQAKWQMPISDTPLLQWQQCEIFDGGEGTADKPYQISSPAQLAVIYCNPWLLDKSFVLTEDIDAFGVNITPFAGYWSTAFTGTFDGAKHTIYNLVISAPNTELTALFGNVEAGAIIKDLALDNVFIYSEKDFTAAFAGWCKGTIQGCCVVDGEISGVNQVGGIAAGLSNNAAITDCYTDCRIMLSGQIGGGIASDVSGSAAITNCYAAGAVIGNWTGGLAAKTESAAAAVNCFFNSQTNGWSALGVGKTEAELEQASTFAAWDMQAVWRQKDKSMPAFAWQTLKIDGDFNGDEMINGFDLHHIADNWLGGDMLLFPAFGNYNPSYADYQDFAEMAHRWQGLEPLGTSCQNPIIITEGPQYTAVKSLENNQIWFAFNVQKTGLYFADLFSYGQLPNIDLYTDCAMQPFVSGFGNTVFEAAAGQTILICSGFYSDFCRIRIQSVEPLVNQDCANAFELTLGRQEKFNNIGSVSEGKSIWVKFTAPRRGIYHFDTSRSSYKYASLDIFDSCEDTEPMNFFHGGAMVDMLQGQTVYVRINPYDTIFDLYITVNEALPVPNDNCYNAMEIFSDTLYYGNNLYAMDNGRVWFSFTPAQSGLYIADASGSDLSFTELAFYNGCNEDPNAYGMSQCMNYLNGGQTYLISLSSYESQGDWQLIVTQMQPPSNISCQDAMIVQENVTYYNQNTASPEQNYSLWYSFTPQSSGTYLINALATNSGPFASNIDVLTDCQQTPSAAPQSGVSVQYLEEGATYLVKVFSQWEPLMFDFRIEPLTVPQNDDYYSPQTVYLSKRHHDGGVILSNIGATGVDMDNCLDEDSSDIWVLFIPPATADYSINLAPMSEVNASLTLYEQKYGKVETPLLCSNGQYIYMYTPLQKGKRYYFRIATTPQQQSVFSFSVFSYH